MEAVVNEDSASERGADAHQPTRVVVRDEEVELVANRSKSRDEQVEGNSTSRGR
jgi:hypothetical protein